MTGHLFPAALGPCVFEDVVGNQLIRAPHLASHRELSSAKTWNFLQGCSHVSPLFSLPILYVGHTFVKYILQCVRPDCVSVSGIPALSGAVLLVCG